MKEQKRCERKEEEEEGGREGQDRGDMYMIQKVMEECMYTKYTYI